MQGLHLTADLQGCPCDAPEMTEPEALGTLCLRAVASVGLQPVGRLFHRFPGGGVTGVVLLAESHVAVHTWPELGGVTLDVYVCNLGEDNSGKAERLLGRLLEAFSPGRVERHALRRGRPGP